MSSIDLNHEDSENFICFVFGTILILWV